MAAPTVTQTRNTPRLGKGLSSLMRPTGPVHVPAQPTPAPEKLGTPVVVAPPSPLVEGLTQLPVQSIVRNPHQPRHDFDPAALQRLADSIKAEGVIQPIVVRPAAKPTGTVAYELVAGERRWRAAQLAGLTQIPAIIKKLDDRQIAEWALIENLQREDLNPMERAEAFQHLLTTFGLTHDQVADRVGVERPSVSNSLRLLSLHKEVQQFVRTGLLSGGQAKVLAGINDPAQQKVIAERSIKQQWSVRQVEFAARMIGKPAEAMDAPAKPIRAKSMHLADLEEQIGKALQTKVAIRPGRKKGTGTLSIEFFSIDQFDTIMQKLGVQTD